MLGGINMKVRIEFDITGKQEVFYENETTVSEKDIKALVKIWIIESIQHLNDSCFAFANEKREDIFRINISNITTEIH